jgi:hypothetical protein
MFQSIAFAELVAYVEEELDENETPVLMLPDLVKIYNIRLDQLRKQQGSKVHATRLKQKLLSHIPGLQALSTCNCILLVRDIDVGGILSETLDLKTTKILSV